MEKIFDDFLKGKDEKVYIIDAKCYDNSKNIVGPYLTNEISVYRNEQGAKDAIKRKIWSYKNDRLYSNVNVDDRFEDMICIAYSYYNDPSQSFRVIISMIERELK